MSRGPVRRFYPQGSSGGGRDGGEGGLTSEAAFELRWRRGLRDLVGPARRLYGAEDGWSGFLDRLRALLGRHWRTRPAALRALDLGRDLEPDWFLSQDMVGYVFYVDRFAGSLGALPDRIDYLKALGVTYAHMMSCLMPRPGESDGGYAVMDYRRIDPRLGDMEDSVSRPARFARQG